MTLLPRVPLGAFFDWSSLTAADRALVDELRILRPDWPGQQQPGGGGGGGWWNNRQPQLPLRVDDNRQPQQEPERQRQERQRNGERQRMGELSEYLSRKVYKHRHRAHSYEGRVDELARAEARMGMSERILAVALEEEGEV
ncbi:hypothetical protein CONLIGDRAFT_650785 [Coniochaeta ligniaria NRRL 30616]|uniref:Uncharacterized protein n=1 Tax=Coniochaeta ligniaria NRRL 30616 TaxID=1408157 RepID=A0A1J7I3A8_9PEZI|nr:hypothetical protein CONLIGDRAFT_650785 [Coniochaeta ligniaria NRRL 30616]